MDGPVMRWLHRNIASDDVAGAQVLEVGSGDVNGSVRPHVRGHWPASYLGVDIAPGKGVDRVVSVHDLVGTLGRDAFDVVISTEMLEHVEDWRDAILQLKLALRPGGLLVLTTRAPGFPRHCHPHDHWRFTAADLRAIFADFEVLACRHVAGRGVVIKARKPLHGRGNAVDLDAIDVEAAPAKDWGWKRQRAWVLWAYRGRKPTVPSCCPMPMGVEDPFCDNFPACTADDDPCGACSAASAAFNAGGGFGGVPQ